MSKRSRVNQYYKNLWTDKTDDLMEDIMAKKMEQSIKAASRMVTPSKSPKGSCCSHGKTILGGYVHSMTHGNNFEKIKERMSLLTEESIELVQDSGTNEPTQAGTKPPQQKRQDEWKKG